MGFDGALTENPLSVVSPKATFREEKISPDALFPKIFQMENKHKTEHVRVDLDDEYDSVPKVQIDVIQPVVLEVKDKNGQMVTKDLTEQIQSEFKFLSATRALEIGTPRTDIVQGYIDKMVRGNQEWEGKARVVIMNKGQEPSAFAYPDGTIFISQSLINLYDSLDEVIAIMAHEVKHLINGTTKAAYQAESLRGTSTGVDWLHEMASDFGSLELLEKVGLKTTAMAEALSKLSDYFGNRRGFEHQAPIVRATEQLGAHAIKDYETSHLDYTPLPPELRSVFRMTNFESIIDAAVRDDVGSVELYLPKLHPRDLERFFEIADSGSYLGLSEIYPGKGTDQKVAEKVEALVSQRLRSEGLSESEVKLFFLSTTRGYSRLSPSFNDISEIESLAALAEKMFQGRVINQASRKLFGVEMKGDPLKNLVNFVAYNFDQFTNNDAVFYTDIDSMARFIGTVNGLIKRDLPHVKDGSFVDLEGKALEHDSNRSARLYEDLTGILFRGYIRRFYLSNVSDGELDQKQIEDIFQAVKTAGFESLTNSYYFPIREEDIGSGNRQIIETAYRNIFGTDLVRKVDNQNVQPLPTPAEFLNQIQGKSRWDIEQILLQLEYEHKLDTETKALYVQKGLEYFEEFNFDRRHLEALIEGKIGFWAIRNWRENGNPRKDSVYQIMANLQDASTETSGQGENSIHRMTVDEVILDYGLDRDVLYAEANRLGEIDRTSSEIEFVANIIASSEDRLFGFIEPIMRNTKVDIKTLDQFQLIAICRPLFNLADSERDVRISDFDRFFQLPLVQEIASKVESVHFENLQDLSDYIKEVGAKYGHINIGAKFSLYEDSVYSVLLAKPVRDELRRLTQPGSLSQKDYPVLVTLLNENFPYSPQRRELIKSLQTAYLNNPEIAIQDKMDFYFREYKLLGFEGAILVAEQITDIPTYRVFKQKLDQLAIEYVSGKESLDAVASTDIASSLLTQKADLLIKTASGSRQISTEVSTDLATEWVKTYLGEKKWRNRDIQYEKKTGKFILTEAGRSAFATFSDTVDFFRNLPDSQRLAIALKSMSDQNGLLVSEEGRTLLEKMLIDGLGLKDEFLKSALSSAIEGGDAKIVGLPAAQMLSPFMFRALNTDAIDLIRLRDTKLTEDENGSTVYRKIKDKDYSEDLPKILISTTRDIRYFGSRYRRQPDSVIGRQAQESGSVYFETLNNLMTQLVSVPETSKVTENGRLPAATEAMIKAGETSPVFVRGMQMAVQLVNFDSAVQERLLQTQDSMKGMEKLRFWDNLLSKAQGDPELARFLEEDLITLDSYLGGGSLFTTYGATVKGDNGSPKKVVIKMLNPNAEEFIRLSYNFSKTVLSEVEQNNRGKTRQDARLAGSLLDLSNIWCIRDINDSTYSERDDAFRSTVQSFNNKTGRPAIDAPERRYTSKKVKVEDQYHGITLNKFLANPEIADEKKREVVDNLLGFFDFQFEFSPLTKPDGEKVFIFHSDPHTGNYMVDPELPAQTLGAIDRSMYLSLEEKDVEMFKLLKSDNGGQFISGFIGRCLEISGIEGAEASKIRYGLLNQLGGELVRQKLGRRTNAVAYLQIVMQEFSQYGERYLPLETAGEQSTVETMISTYFRNNSETNALNAYDALKDKLSSGESRTVTYQQFKEMLAGMLEKGCLRKKSIEVPLEYRLMIRNIIAMKKLRQRWIAR